VKAAAEAGATHVTPLTLHLRPGVKEEFMPWLAENHPELVGRYGSMYRRSYAPKEVTEPIGRTVGELRRRYGVSRDRATGGRGGPPAATQTTTEPAGPSTGTNQAPPPAGGAEEAEQLSLDMGAAPARRAPARPALVRGTPLQNEP